MAGDPSRRKSRNRFISLLLLIPVVVPAVTPLFNFDSPRLGGIPAFYWIQTAFVVLGSVVTIVVYRATTAAEG